MEHARPLDNFFDAQGKLLDQPIVDVCKDLHLFADEERMHIIHLLMEGPKNVRTLAQLRSISGPLVSHHLEILRNASIVDFTRKGKVNTYSLTTEFQHKFTVGTQLIAALTLAAGGTIPQSLEK